MMNKAPRTSAPHLDTRSPDFTLRDLDGRTVVLAELCLLAPLVVAFCRPTDGCARALREFKKRYAALLEAGATLVVVAVGAEAEARKMVDRERLPYRVLCDESGETLRAWGLTERVKDDAISTFVIDKSGTIRFRSLETDDAQAARALDWLNKHGGEGQAQS